MHTPLISVVIPVYNRESFIGGCLDSVLAQTYRNFEMIVVDDCSNDDTLKVINTYRDKVRAFTLNEHSGAPAARNRGIMESKGELIAFLDSDDTWAPEKLEVFARAYADFPQNQFLISDFVRYNTIVKKYYALSSSQVFPSIYACIQKQQYTDLKAFSIDSATAYQLFLLGYPPFSSALMATKQLCRTIGGWSEELPNNQDLDFTLRCALETDITYIDRQLSVITRHGGNLSNDLRKQALGGLRVIEKQLSECKDDALRRKLLAAKGKRLCGIGYTLRKEQILLDSATHYFRALRYRNVSAHAFSRIMWLSFLGLKKALRTEKKKKPGVK